MNHAIINKHIKKIRLDKGYTQECLAEKSDISTQHLSNIERSKAMPSLNVFIKIVNGLEVTASDILDDHQKPGGRPSNAIMDKMGHLDGCDLKIIYKTISAMIKEWNRIFD